MGRVGFGPSCPAPGSIVQLAETIENHEGAFTFGFTTRFFQNATGESYRNKAIQACLPSCNSVQYFLQISLKSSGLFLFEKKYQETCVCENRIHKIQTSTGLNTKVFRSV